MKFISLLLPIALAGCATQHTGEAMSEQWKGKRADEFFAKHGAAKTQQRLSDGRSVYIWETVANASLGGPQVYCSADIVADRAGIISDIRPREDSIGLWNLSRCAEVFR